MRHDREPRGYILGLGTQTIRFEVMKGYWAVRGS